MLTKERTDTKIITVDVAMYSKSPEEKTARANEVARSFGVPDEAIAAVEDFKKQLTDHGAWNLPFMGYVNDDEGFGYSYVDDAAITPLGWDAHAAFKNLPYDVKTAFAIRMLFTHRDVDRYGAGMFLHYDRGFTIRILKNGKLCSRL
ncbi:MAG: glycerophosphodiester phosphodiesterase [Bifidobacteriaceae bacterium]|jgi:hypothetical protein|nr:glycerophosphodiester phosphodiesterase [Bifidobacteriaceae bacterium]